MDEKQNAIQIFNCDNLKHTSTMDQFKLLGIAAHTLSQITSASEYGLDSKYLWKWMREVSGFFHPLNSESFNELYMMASEEIVNSTIRNEYYYHDLFKHNISKLMLGAKIIDRKNNGKDIPDAWVEFKNELIPVEIKVKMFDRRAKAQLERYMNAYKCRYGIAVGKQLTTDLPNNIAYISTSDLDSIDSLNI